MSCGGNQLIEVKQPEIIKERKRISNDLKIILNPLFLSNIS